MTLKQRNLLTIGGLGLSTILFGLSIYFCAALIKNTGTTNIGTIFPAFGESFYSIAAGFLLYFFFRKTKSVEIFFFALFVFSISFEGLKIVITYIASNNESLVIGMALTRLVYGARIWGTGCILASSLHPYMGKYQKLDFIIYIILLLSFAFSTLIPIDASALSSGGLYRSGSHLAITTASLITEIGAIVSYVIYAYENKNREYRMMGLGLALVVLGKLLLVLNFGAIPSVLGFFMISGGTVLFAMRIHTVYLWL